jgi:hypothetical protein
LDLSVDLFSKLSVLFPSNGLSALGLVALVHRHHDLSPLGKLTESPELFSAERQMCLPGQDYSSLTRLQDIVKQIRFDLFNLLASGHIDNNGCVPMFRR